MRAQQIAPGCPSVTQTFATGAPVHWSVTLPKTPIVVFGATGGFAGLGCAICAQGVRLGTGEGDAVGDGDGEGEAVALGVCVGAAVRATVGSGVARMVGWAVRSCVGSVVGDAVGDGEGDADSDGEGERLSDALGEAVGVDVDAVVTEAAVALAVADGLADAIVELSATSAPPLSASHPVRAASAKVMSTRTRRPTTDPFPRHQPENRHCTERFWPLCSPERGNVVSRAYAGDSGGKAR